jgi:hypothetical protein
MSLGTTTVGFPTALNDIVNLATLGASAEVLVVVAAGNCGAHGADSMSAWARPDWLLSVGATDDPAGTRLAPYSSRGSPGPDLVALGKSELNDKVHGTSFAAPRVTHLAQLVVAAFCQLGREVMVAQGLEPMGVPAVGNAIIDDFGDAIWWDRANTSGFQALPLLGVDRDIIAKLVQLTGSALTVRGTPQLVRRVLLASARAVPGADPSTAGAGFVNSAIVIEHLATITGADLWHWFGASASPDQ